MQTWKFYHARLPVCLKRNETKERTERLIDKGMGDGILSLVDCVGMMVCSSCKKLNRNWGTGDIYFPSMTGVTLRKPCEHGMHRSYSMGYHLR